MCFIFSLYTCVCTHTYTYTLWDLRGLGEILGSFIKFSFSFSNLSVAFLLASVFKEYLSEYFHFVLKYMVFALLVLVKFSSQLPCADVCILLFDLLPFLTGLACCISGGFAFLVFTPEKHSQFSALMLLFYLCFSVVCNCGECFFLVVNRIGRWSV